MLATGVKGIRLRHLVQACRDEFAENEDLPNTTNPDDWANIAGKKGERIVFIRTLTAANRGPSRVGPSTRSATPGSTCRSSSLRAGRPDGGSFVARVLQEFPKAPGGNLEVP